MSVPVVLDVIGLVYGAAYSGKCFVFVFLALSGPCWCNDFLFFGFVLPSVVEWRLLFGNFLRINVHLHGMHNVEAAWSTMKS